MAASQYLLLAVLLESTRRRNDISSHLLALILVLNTFKAIDVLLVWSDSLRNIVLAWDPDILLLGGFAYWLEGPLLYGYVSAVLYRDFRFKPLYLIHLVPVCVLGAILLWLYYLQPDTTQVEMMGDLEFMWGGLMTHTITLRNLSIMLYGSWCLYELHRYRRLLRDNYANLEDRERRWLTWFVSGFVLIASWALLIHAIGNRIGSDLANMLGICTNYFTFFFVNSLVFISIRYTHLFDGIDDQRNIPAEPASPYFKQEQVERLQSFMAKEKPFLDSNISIELLAKRLSLPERTLSRILNQHFGKNFFEFINGYRVEEAKRLLRDAEHQNASMLDILAMAGFTSKSTFNTIFKKHLGQTPSQYRQENSSDKHTPT
jgi:AraC-like DNA-binding protein